MDSYDISDAKELPPKKRSYAIVWNVLTVLVLITILCVASVFFLIFVDPNSDLNPFPPPTLYPSMAPPTITITPRFTLVPSWTPTNVSAQLTNTPGAPGKPISTNTPITKPPAMEPTIAVTPGEFAFVLRQGSPSAITGATFHPDAGCNWSGIGGQATSLNGEAVGGLLVQLGGSMPGAEIMGKSTMTGLATQYGPGGFEFTLANNPVSSDDTLWIQLTDQQNLPLSDRVYFNTYDDCQKNLIIIYFDQIR